MISKEMEEVIKLLKSLQSNNSAVLSIEQLRKNADQAGEMIKIPNDVKYEYIEVGGLPVAWVTTPESNTNRVILYLHGGAYILGSITSSRALTLAFLRMSNARILTVDYRLAPEHPFPAGLEDSISVYKWLIESEKIKPENIIIAGASAGGGLTVATLIKLRDEGVPLPSAGIAISPWADLTCSSESFTQKAELDPWLTPEGLKNCAKFYGRDNDLRNPYISTVFADFKGLPSLYIQVGTSEILLDDSIHLAEQAKAAGVDVKLDIWENLIHVFAAFETPETQQARERIEKFIKEIYR